MIGYHQLWLLLLVPVSIQLLLVLVLNPFLKFFFGGRHNLCIHIYIHIVNIIFGGAIFFSFFTHTHTYTRTCAAIVLNFCFNSYFLEERRGKQGFVLVLFLVLIVI